MIQLIATIFLASTIVVVALYWLGGHLSGRWKPEYRRYLLPVLITAALTAYPFHQPEFWPLASFVAFLLIEAIMAKCRKRSCAVYAGTISVLMTPSMSYPFLVSPAILNPFIESYAPYFRTWPPLFRIGHWTMPGNWRLMILSVLLIVIVFLLARRYCRQLSIPVSVDVKNPD